MTPTAASVRSRARRPCCPTGADYAVDLLPPGLYFPDPVHIELVAEDGSVAEIPLTPSLFTFEPRYFDSIPETSPGAGFSGLRLRHPLNTPDHMDEVLVVQGASYFRAIGRAMVYGLSGARRRHRDGRRRWPRSSRASSRCASTRAEGGSSGSKA